MDIANLLKNIDPETLKKGIAQAQEFLATPEGQNAAQMLSQGKMPDGGQMPEALKSFTGTALEDEKVRNTLGELAKRALGTK